MNPTSLAAPRLLHSLVVRHTLRPIVWSSSTIVSTQQRPIHIAASIAVPSSSSFTSQPSIITSARRTFSSSGSSEKQQQQSNGSEKAKSEEKSNSNDSGSAGGEQAKGGYFSSDAWTKTVGTIGALANWTIPLAGITHMMSSKDPGTTIDPVMTSALAVYSLLFMRWALAVTPANYPLLVCHISNEIVQLIQIGRYATAASKKPAIEAPKK